VHVIDRGWRYDALDLRDLHTRDSRSGPPGHENP
jgi:hypothetical protein